MTDDLERLINDLRGPDFWQAFTHGGGALSDRQSSAPFRAADEIARLRAENEINLAAMLWAAEEFAATRGETPDGWFGHCRKNIVAGVSEEHCGDCTNVPQSCMKCWADHYLERARRALQEGPSHE